MHVPGRLGRALLPVVAVVAALLATVLVTSATAEVRFEGQVMNGQPADIEDLPSVVAVETDAGAACTGTLVAPTWVLTAGHCFDSADEGVIVGFGADTYDALRWVYGSRVVIHPDFDITTLNADLALIELSGTATQPVQALARAGLADPVGASATITGWGMLDLENSTDSLQRAQVPVLHDDTCEIHVGYDGTTFVCAGGQGTDVCPGDSGGPLLVSLSGVLTQVGIVSYGEDCTPASSTIGAYTAIGAYRSWIDGYVGAADPQPEPEPGFIDVPADGAHAANIGILVEAGITQGYADGTFRPGRSVSRAQMAAFLARALGIDLATVDATAGGFSDVPVDHPHARAIAAVVERGIAGGYADGTFGPGNPVSRAQMATFLAKALGVDLAAVDTADTGFPDVRSTDTHARGVVAVAERGITGGLADGTFGPTRSVSRGQMASFLVAAFDLAG